MNRDDDMKHLVSPTHPHEALAALLAGGTVGDATNRTGVEAVAQAARERGVEVVVRDVWAGPGATLWTIAHQPREQEE